MCAYSLQNWTEVEGVRKKIDLINHRSIDESVTSVEWCPAGSLFSWPRSGSWWLPILSRWSFSIGKLQGSLWTIGHSGFWLWPLTMTLLPGSVLPWQSNCWRQGRLEYDFGRFVSLQSINELNLKCSIIECHWTVSNLFFPFRLDSKAGPSLRYHIIFYLDSVQFCVSFVQPVALGTLLHLLQSFSFTPNLQS